MKLQATINKIDDWANGKLKYIKANPRTLPSLYATKLVQQYKWAVLIYPRKTK
jgi:hypothetical protein